ncbi:hypothetical protein FZC84_00385 [Rossellomorea vietnamensis]|uniref:Uncharacterized protein n=1 Tax=Rossellomorea vietnamensis TaxID=218284 RepID=A0A5D4MHF3_9BACI|nr:hypothetical protein [Rossellomorea vietnamensis]TYS01163.1 hypothetical protein FZC84_00385 [Rossellomorea vietnamensis]
MEKQDGNREDKMKKTYNFLSIIILLLTAFCMGACSAGEEVVDIEDKSFAEMLFVQKVENDLTDETLTKSITDQSKIEETLELVSGLTIKELSTNEFFTELKSQNSYMFSFFKTEQFTSGVTPYTFYILEDGTFMFTYDGVDSLREKPLISLESDKDLFDKIKEHLEIDF